jgi:AcrR family transcriptional regulator
MPQNYSWLEKPRLKFINFGICHQELSTNEVRKLMSKEKPNMRQEQAAETRRNLLDSALKLFAENGFSATPVRSINQKIGMADGLLYHYFPGGKKEMLQVLVLENYQLIVSRLRVIQTENFDDLTLEEVIERLYQNWRNIFTDYRHVIKILFRETDLFNLLDKASLSKMRGSETWFQEILRDRAQKGEIKEFDYVSAAEVLKAVLFDHFLTAVTGIGPGLLDNDNTRKRIIAYQVGLWKR